MVKIYIKELQMVFKTSNVSNSNGNMKELERKLFGVKSNVLIAETISDA